MGELSVTDWSLPVTLQAISALAVAGGLAYAALQFREWRSAQYVANFTKLIELQLQLRKMVVDDPTLAPIGLGVPPNEMRGYFYNLMQLSLFEIAWFSHGHGQLTEDYFASWVGSMALIARRPAFRGMWQSGAGMILHDGFRQYVETLVTSLNASDKAREGGTPSPTA